MFDGLFIRKKLSPKKAEEYGFFREGEGYAYSALIMDGEFTLKVAFDSGGGNLNTNMYECDTGDEYTLYKTDAEGVYIGKVRAAIEAVLADIVDKCFVSSGFKQRQTEALVAYGKSVYGSSAEFLWEDTPDCAIMRRGDSGKWYVVIQTVSKRKLGIASDDKAEILNLHGEKEDVAELLARDGIYPAWHMNKKSWFTVILDGSVEDDMLFSLVDESYRLAGKQAKNNRKLK